MRRYLKAATIIVMLSLEVCLLARCSSIEPRTTIQSQQEPIVCSQPNLNESSVPGDVSTDEKNYQTSTLETTINADIYNQVVQEKGYHDILIAIDDIGNASIVDCPLFNMKTIQDGFIMGSTAWSSGKGELATFNLSNKNVFYSGYWLSNAVNFYFFDNNIVAIAGFYQLLDTDDHNCERPLLMDNQCTPLVEQLQFEYGQSHPSGLGDEFLIIGLAYRPSNATYIALFSKNPYFSSISNEEYDNTLCELGITIFDEGGNQLEQYMLNGVFHPLNTRQQKNAAILPLLYLIDDNTVLIIPQSDQLIHINDKNKDSEHLPDYSINPIAVNLNNHSFVRWSKEEFIAFLDHSTQYDGERKYGYWNIGERPENLPFELRFDEDAMFISADDNSLPLFALPKRYYVKLYHKVDNVHYLVFSLRSS